MLATPADELRTGGVTLRRWRVADADVVYRAVHESIEHLAPWMPWAGAGYTEDDAARFVERSEAEWAAREAFNYAILLDGPVVGAVVDSTVVGSCGIMMAGRLPGVLEVGYWLHHGYLGRGIATTAAAALTTEAFRVGATHVLIGHDAANTRSGAVPRRLGFTEHARFALDPQTSGDSGTTVSWRIDAATWERVRRPD